MSHSRSLARIAFLTVTVLVLVWFNTSTLKAPTRTERTFDEWRRSVRPVLESSVADGSAVKHQYELRVYFRLAGNQGTHTFSSPGESKEGQESSHQLIRLIDLIAEIPEALNTAPQDASTQGVQIEVLDDEAVRFRAFISEESLQKHVQSQLFVKLVQLFSSEQHQSRAQFVGGTR